MVPLKFYMYIALVGVPRCASESCGHLSFSQSPKCQQVTTDGTSGAKDEGSEYGKASCDFRTSLCSYNQGCLDPNASPWAHVEDNDYAEMKGRSDIANSYSVLESPELSITLVSCLNITYVIHNPSQLAVFLDNGTNTCNLLPPEQVGIEKALNKVVTLHKAEGKLLFMGRSGGSDVGFVRLKSVEVEIGRCEDPDCDFLLSTATGCQGWDWKEWERKGTPNMVAALRQSLPSGTLTTDTIRADKSSRGCLTFHYSLTAANDSLEVLLKPVHSEARPLWEVANNHGQDWLQASLPIASSTAFKILFVGKRYNPAAHSLIAIDTVKFTRDASKCPYTPANATPSLDETRQGKTTSVMTQPGDEQENGVAVIAGSSAAAGIVFLSILLVVAVIVWRRRKEKSGKSRTFSTNQADVKLSDVIGADGGHSHISRRQNNPYDIVEDDVPEESGDLASDEYNVLDVHGAGKRPPRPPGAGDDVYSHINNHPAEPGVDVLYSEIQETGEVGSTQQSPVAQPGQDAVYSQVQKKGKNLTAQKPSVATNTSITEKSEDTDQYNRINFTQPSQPRNGSASQNGCEDTYNRLINDVQV